MPPRAAFPRAGRARLSRGAVRCLVRAALLGAASLLVASSPRVSPAAVAQRVRTPTERAARDAQRKFEGYRRSHLPRVAPHQGDCDVTIGRFCYWDDNFGTPLPAERSDVGSARTRLRAALDSLSTLDPSSDYIMGQRVRYALEAGDASSAAALLEQCAATPWWCQALRGLTWHRAGDEVRSAAAFDSVLTAMPDTLRCTWLDLEAWLPSGAHMPDADDSDCVERERLSARVFWLAAPLLSWRPNATRDEFLSRRTMAAIISRTATPHRMSWGSDLDEMALRFGWPELWAREDTPPAATITSPEVRVLGHEPTPSFSFVPNRHALESPFEASPGDWELSGGRAPSMRYAPGWLTLMDTIPVQIARFSRADGDSMVIVAVYDARAFLGDMDTTASDGNATVGAGNAAVDDGDASAGGTDTALSAAAILAVAADSTLASSQAAGSPSGAMTLAAVSRPAIAAVEVIDSASERAARWRGGVVPLSRAALVSDLLVGIAGAAAPLVMLDSAARHAIAALRVSAGDTIALYWESYARATPAHPAHVALRLFPLSAGFLNRIGRWFGLAHADPPISLAWVDPGRADAEVGRSLRIGIPDVPRGRYRIELVVEAGGGRGTAARVIQVR